MEAIIQHLALVSESSSVQMSDLLRVAAALQKQASRDVARVVLAQLANVALGGHEDDAGQ